METYTCSCCIPAKSYSEKRNLRKHQRKFDKNFVFGGTAEVVEDKTCLHCENRFRSKDKMAKFCSRSCSASYNKNRSGTGYLAELLECELCSNEFKPRVAGRKFCSIACSNKAQHASIADEIQHWINGDATIADTISNDLRGSFRNYLLKQSNNTCSECGWSKANPVTGRVPVQVDHIDGDSTNNAYKNLRVLCPNCHSLTSNYGSLNKGKGREYRREYRAALRSVLRSEGMHNDDGC